MKETPRGNECLGTCEQAYSSKKWGGSCNKKDNLDIEPGVCEK